MKWLLGTSISTLLASSTSAASAFAKDELANLLQSLKGDDDRLFRPDASEHTVERQKAGDCAKLVDAAKLIASLPSGDAAEGDLELAAEYVSFCMVENPANRATFAGAAPNVYKAVVTLVGSENEWVSKSASRVIYVSVFGNEKNHKAFFQQGAVAALAKVFIDEEKVPAQRMYAAAALQNLAASYCKRENETSNCPWMWTENAPSIQVDPTTPLISDGSAVRKQILATEGLVASLVTNACQHPIPHPAEDSEEEEELVLPGSTAVEGEHSELGVLITWAAMAVLRNLALEPTALPVLFEKGALECACYIRDSADWLEASKGNDLLYFARRSENACWPSEDELDMCVDGNFFDGENTCDAFHEDSELDCEASVDKFSGTKASELCCGCGGGTIWTREELGDEL